MAKRKPKVGTRAREIAAGMEAAEYRRIALADLVRWDRNPRTQMDEGSTKLAATIGAVGWGADVLVQAGTNRVIGGHLRLLAAEKLGLESVPCKVLSVDDARADELALADNRASEFAAWDEPALAALLQTLDPERREAVGWDQPAFDALMNEPPGLDPSGVEFPEFDETAADGVKLVSCPHCGGEVPVG